MTRTINRVNTLLVIFMYLIATSIAIMSVMQIMSTWNEQHYGGVMLPEMCKLVSLRGCWEHDGITELTINRAVTQGNKFTIQYVIMDVNGYVCHQIERYPKVQQSLACDPRETTTHVTNERIIPARVMYLKNNMFGSYTMNYIGASLVILAAVLLIVIGFKTPIEHYNDTYDTKTLKSSYEML
ncbi:hypothetical protein F-liban_235 [Faustovirus]|nr:hypothetical protein F-liban_235 [Faustovirus]SME64911.1 Hypothetical protein FSTVST1_226 [Faustovirus ST1]